MLRFTWCARTVPSSWRRGAERAVSLTASRTIEGILLAREEATTRQTLIFDDNQMAAALYGEDDRTLRILEQELGIAARARGNEVRLVGSAEEVGMARKVLEELYGALRFGNPVHPRDVRQAVRMVTEQPDVDLQMVYEDVPQKGLYDTVCKACWPKGVALPEADVNADADEDEKTDPDDTSDTDSS